MMRGVGEAEAITVERNLPIAPDGASQAHLGLVFGARAIGTGSEDIRISVCLSPQELRRGVHSLVDGPSRLPRHQQCWWLVPCLFKWVAQSRRRRLQDQQGGPLVGQCPADPAGSKG